MVSESLVAVTRKARSALSPGNWDRWLLREAWPTAVRVLWFRDW